MRTVLGVLGIAAVVAATSHPIGAQETPGGKADKNSKSWEAVAPGLVEARSGEIKIWAPVIGRICEIQVNANDKVLTGEALLRLDDPGTNSDGAGRGRNAQAGKSQTPPENCSTEGPNHQHS